MEQTQSAPVQSNTTTPPPAAPPVETQPATQAAVKSGDTAAYRAARRMERAGKPLEPVPAATPDPKAEATAEIPPKPATSRREQRDDEYIGTRIREGVDRGTAELRAEIERLKQQMQPSAPAAAREAEKPYDGSDPSDPKPAPDSFEDFNQYLDARDEWNERRIERKQAKAVDGARVAQERDELTSAQQARVQKFADQLREASTADPEFSSKLTPDVRALKPFAALAPGERGGPENIVAEQVFDSPIAPKVLLHLSWHPDALARLIAMPPEIQAMPAAVRTTRHIQWIVKEFNKLEGRLEGDERASSDVASQPAPAPQITHAPPPAKTLGSRPAPPVDPKSAAVKSGNTAAYREIRRHERAAQLIGRR